MKIVGAGAGGLGLSLSCFIVILDNASLKSLLSSSLPLSIVVSIGSIYFSLDFLIGARLGPDL